MLFDVSRIEAHNMLFDEIVGRACTRSCINARYQAPRESIEVDRPFPSSILPKYIEIPPFGYTVAHYMYAPYFLET